MAPLDEARITRLALAAWLADPEQASELFGSVKRWLREAQQRDPMDATLTVVLVGSALYYAAERRANPRIDSFDDALLYIATSLSVGYADHHPVTPLGKLVGTVVQTYGPSLAAGILGAPAAEVAEQEVAERALVTARHEESLQVEQRILSRLDRLIELMEQERSAPTGV